MLSRKSFRPHDVLLGRSKQAFEHNMHFHLLIAEHSQEYIEASRTEKTLLVVRLTDHIDKELGGRFLRRDEASGKWCKVSLREAKEKVGHALRDSSSKKTKCFGKLLNLKNDEKLPTTPRKAPTRASVSRRTAKKRTRPTRGQTDKQQKTEIEDDHVSVDDQEKEPEQAPSESIVPAAPKDEPPFSRPKLPTSVQIYDWPDTTNTTEDDDDDHDDGPCPRRFISSRQEDNPPVAGEEPRTTQNEVLSSLQPCFDTRVREIPDLVSSASSLASSSSLGSLIDDMLDDSSFIEEDEQDKDFFFDKHIDIW